MNNSESPSWFGWLWTGDTWERVCSGDSIAECSRRLSEQAHRRGIRTDKYSCMTGGGCPAIIPHDATRAILGAANSIPDEDDL